jgi:LPXTG-motif cell wall-anchored protein
MRTLFRASILGALVAIASVSPAYAAVAPAPLALSMVPTSGVAGTAVAFSPIDNCPVAPGFVETATLALTPGAAEVDLLDSQPVDGSGSWALNYTIPLAAPLGDITFYVECRGTFISTVEGAPSAPDPGDIVAPAGIGRSYFGAPLPTTLATYTPAVFTVTAPPTTTTSSTSTTTTAVITTTTTTPPGMTASPTFMYQGESCSIAAHGFKPGSDVDVTVHSAPFHVATIVADANGSIASVWQVPLDFETGQHTIVLTGTTIGGEVLSMNGQVTIGARISAAQPTAAPTSTGTLPRTGTEIQPMLILAATLLVGGAAVVVATRRRRAVR